MVLPENEKREAALPSVPCDTRFGTSVILLRDILHSLLRALELLDDDLVSEALKMTARFRFARALVSDVAGI